jgi:hypothetical protein
MINRAKLKSLGFSPQTVRPYLANEMPHASFGAREEREPIERSSSMERSVRAQTLRSDDENLKSSYTKYDKTMTAVG